MNNTLKNLINSYQKKSDQTNRLEMPNFQIIEKNFVGEEISFLDDDLFADLTFSGLLFKESSLTDIKFTNGNFFSGYFNQCFLESCTFTKTSFQSTQFRNCTLNNCILKSCDLTESTFIETIFDGCQIQRDDNVYYGSLNLTYFESCHFIETNFDGFDRGQLNLANLMNSKFSNSKRSKSIKFQGMFSLGDILRSENGISEMFLDY